MFKKKGTVHYSLKTGKGKKKIIIMVEIRGQRRVSEKKKKIRQGFHIFCLWFIYSFRLK